MSELKKTGAFVLVALVLCGAAFVRLPDRSRRDQSFKDQGLPFFPEFKDPTVCTDLEVVDYDPGTAATSRFQVKLKDGKWVIPSHYDYPADAKDRLAKTASGVIDLNKDTIRSDLAEDHATLGVIDPLDEKSTELKGRGKRVTLRDKTENTLADFIIVNEVRERPEQHYVRVPGQKRTYGVNVKVELSTKFADWIETNLLKLDAGRIRRVIFRHDKVDPDRGSVVRGETFEIDREASSGPWKLEGGVPAGEELSNEKLQALSSALADLKIVGVRPKPAGLTRDLKTAEGIKLTQQALLSLNSRGFYPTRDGRLLSNQGDVSVATDEGVVYTLRFGEVVFATGEDLSRGDDSPGAAKSTEKAKDDKKKDGASESRYLMVTVGFDPALLPPAHPAEKPPVGPLVIPDDPFQKAPDDPARIAEEKAAKEKFDREEAEHARRSADGEKRVKELTDRFADWYYVTPGESFRSISLERKELLKAKVDPANQDPNAPPPALPGLNVPGLPGLPDAH